MASSDKRKIRNQIFFSGRGIMMKHSKMKMRTFACASAAMIAAMSLGGCGSNETAQTGDKITIKWWTNLFPHVSQTATNFGEVPLYQELEKRLNVNLEFIHPAAGQESQSFNIMVASGDLPDIIEHDFTTYDGGPQKAIDDGVIIELDDYLKDAPNYKKLLDSDSEINKQVITDSGKHYTFAWIRGDESLMCWQGLQARKDLLDKAGLSLPETIDDWDTALRAFKSMGVQYPLSVTSKDFYFSGAWGVGDSYYVDNGKVKYGPAEPGYKSYVEKMNEWYKEGLLDPDFFAQDGKTYEAKITSGQVGAYFGAVGGAMGKYIPVLKEKDPGIELSGTKYPVLTKGDTPKFGQKDFAYYPTTSVSISTQCKNVPEVVKFLDYGYSEEGHMLYNFGIEGTSYEMADGYPKYTDLITNNPDGLSMQHAMSRYMASAYGGPFVQDKRYFEQYMPYDEQKEAVALWVQHDDRQRMPMVSYTSDESASMTSKATAVSSLIKENVVKFITGQRSMDEWDSFVAQLHSAGLDDIIAIRQSALDRYNNR